MVSTLRELKPYREREFFPEGVDWSQPKAVVAAYDGLLQQEVNVDADAVQWLNSWRELDSIGEQEFKIRRIEMTCDTENEETANHFQEFSLNIMPLLMEKAQEMKDKLLSTPLLKDRVKMEAPVFFRQLQTDAKLFRKKNIDLSTQLRTHSQEYQKICGSMTVEWQGEQVTLIALNKEMDNQDRSVREDACRLSMTRRLDDKDRLDDLFNKMLDIRNRVAKNAGFDNFSAYIFPAKHRYDYTAAECLKFHESIRKHIVPLYASLSRKRKKALKIDSLQPWDMRVDVLGEEMHTPFKNISELVERTGKVFGAVDPELAKFYQNMNSQGLFDLENRKGKAPGGYQSFLPECRLPFIFMNAVGVHRDVTTLLHESGHAFHSYLAREMDPFQIHAPMEFCEVASMSMELMASEYLPDIFGKEVTDQLIRQTLLTIPGLLIQVAMVDAFQHWLYTDPKGKEPEERHKKWGELRKQYLPEVDDSELDLSAMWQSILHIFEVPFYYVEYGIAQLGALQFWQKYLDDKELALSDYKKSLAAGGGLGLKDLFRRANLEWSMEESVIEQATQTLDEKLTAIDL